MKSLAIATTQRSRGGFTLKQRDCTRGFTLPELLVSVFVLVIIIFMAMQLMTTATAITRTGNKHIDTDTQARVVFDRMALDFAQMVGRTDVDYYVKGATGYKGHGNGHGWGNKKVAGQLGSDQLAFFSQVPGYYPSGARSSISLLAYRVNESTPAKPAYQRLERLGKGLLWNAANTSTNQNNALYPIVFLPQTIDGMGKPWYGATNNDNKAWDELDADYETIGPGVFRFEYYYLLKDGRLRDVPWDTLDWPTRQKLGNDPDPITNPNIGLNDVEAIGVTIAVIDPAARALINAANPNSLDDLASDLDDFRSARGRGVGNQNKYIGMMEDAWKTVVETVAQTGSTSSNTPVPPEAAKGIRIYTRYFDLKSL
jgi:prepilin-type N-terminal cleavage/methylation domain-containing protein